MKFLKFFLLMPLLLFPHAEDMYLIKGGMTFLPDGSFAKKDIFVFFFLEKFISFLVKVLKIKFFLSVKILILSFLTKSTPTPKIFMLLDYSLKFFNYIV